MESRQFELGLCRDLDSRSTHSGSKHRHNQLDESSIDGNSPLFSFLCILLMAANILSVQSISKLFGNLLALDGVSLEVPKQRVSILIGPNGSGKTTLINIIS